MSSNYKMQVDSFSPKRSERLRSKRPVEIKTEKDEEDEDQGSSGMSLDVLAHVASETLRKQPKSAKKKSPHKKINIRNIANIDTLTLDQILGLTEKTVVNQFAEASSNELSRTFTYKCQLMPKQCEKQFTSFGSEMRARTEVKRHLYEHLNKLEKQELSGSTKFTAEPVAARERRFISKFGATKKVPAKKTKFPAPEHTKGKDDKIEDKGRKKLKENYINNLDKVKDTEDSVKSIGFIPVPKKLHNNSVSKEILHSQLPKSNIFDQEDSDEENEKRIEENEQFIIELLSKTQPHHDHCYTTIFGKRKNSDYVLRMLRHFGDEEIETIDASNPGAIKRIICLQDTNGKTRKPTPILFLRHRSPDENVPMVSKEEIIDDIEDSSSDMDELIDVESGGVTTDQTISRGEKPYPPMPKSSLAKRGRLGFDLSDISDGSDDERKMKKIRINPLGREGREGNLGWEPKLAMKFIKELKGRKKGQYIPLKCKICNDKTFTAAATLLYHYRSHAGFKPFVCLICNTTFTRQHSLNYHMLIHNNQSRFTCKDCGRKFRHPSHFKEHLRRHTGETPFECLDCGQKFKTRNTYKRHLKTRHGKLLTATGIHNMTSEDFAKVRTRKYHIPLPLPEIAYQMPELTFTKLKQSGKTVDINFDNAQENFLEELKQDIKKEAGSDHESDSELATILEALSQNPERLPDATPHLKEHEVESNVSGVQERRDEPVPNKIYFDFTQSSGPKPEQITIQPNAIKTT